MNRCVEGSFRGAGSWLVVLGVACAVSGEVQADCVIDDESYRVMAAVLLPYPPAPGAAQSPLPDDRQGDAYVIVQEIVPTTLPEGMDGEMAADARSKHEVCSIDAKRLQARLGSGKSIMLINAEERRRIFPSMLEGGGWEKFHQRYPLAGGLTTLSRPLFDQAGTRAVLEMSLRSDYEAGEGYRVNLQKMPQTGVWEIYRATRIRVY